MKAILSALVVLGSSAWAVGAQNFDLLIRGGKLIDGSGSPWRYADVGVVGDRIVVVGDIPADATARSIVDARGLYVSPGYIDPHSHASEALEDSSRAGVRALIAQGITTAFINPDGFGPQDLGPQLKVIRQDHPGVNVAPLVGHGAARVAVMGYENREPTNAELERMKALIGKAMAAGAWGMSDGLFYRPMTYSKTEEVIALAKVASSFHGIYTAHVRDDADYNVGAVGAVDEVIRIAREAKLTSIVTHIKTMGPRGLGLSTQMIAHIDAARAEGLEVWADQHPYLASESNLLAYLVPAWAQEGPMGEVLQRLNSAEVRMGMEDNLVRRGGAGLIQIASDDQDQSKEGKRLGDLAKAQGVEPSEVAIAMLKKAAGRVSVVSFTINESDSDAFMRQPWTMTDTDGGAPVFGVGMPHPRAYGAFPNKIRRDVVERHILTLEQAIHAGTGLTASVHRLKDRGLIREGAFADILVFDLTKLKDTSTYEKPHAYAEGLVDVFVNGQPAIQDSKFLDARAGRILLRNDPSVSER